MAQQYCKRGHDTFVVGRTQRMCRECRRLSDRKRYQSAKRQTYKSRWYHTVGYLRRLNSRADSAMRKVKEALVGHR